MTRRDTGQVTQSAAAVYERFFVPALFAEWPPHLLGAAGLREGQRALDVACGTGALTRVLARELGAAQVVGVDINDGMLGVARSTVPDVRFLDAPAEALPFDDESFDAVFCQFGLMFFQDPVTAIQEARRVLRPGGKMVFAVWDALERSPGYATLTRTLRRMFGEPVANMMRAPFTLGEDGVLAALFERAGVQAEIRRRVGTARFASVQDWMSINVKGWTLSEVIDEVGFQRLLAASESEMRRFIVEGGAVVFDSPALIAVATRE